MWQPTLPPFRTHKKDVYLKHAKTAAFIYQLGEGTTIRERSKEIPVDAITNNETKQKIAYLKKCLLRYRKVTGMGRGIAAVQVGIQERFAVVYMPEIKEKLFTFINPKIIKKSKELLEFPEACMSEGPIFAPVTRPTWIEFTYYDEDGKKQYWHTKDTTKEEKMYNRVLQHEIDHMNGIIFLDRANLKQLTLDSDPQFYDKATFKKIKSA